MKESYRYTIDGRDLIVLDDVFSEKERESIAKVVGAAPFARSESSRHDTANIRHFATNFNKHEIMSSRLGDVARQVVKKYFPGERHGAYRTYCNMGLYGDSAYTHRDANPGSKNVTFLLFANPFWELDWGGETLFYNDKGDCVAAVNPKPGRVILFRGAITHRAGIANRECYVPRYTIALKFGLVRARPKPRSGSRKVTSKKTPKKVPSRRAA